MKPRIDANEREVEFDEAVRVNWCPFAVSLEGYRSNGLPSPETIPKPPINANERELEFDQTVRVNWCPFAVEIPKQRFHLIDFPHGLDYSARDG